jgi:hypothetical protein
METKGLPVALLVLGIGGLLLTTGCTSSYNTLTDYPDQARLNVWPENHDTVARNAAIWVQVTPSYARVTDFELAEVYGSSRYPVPFTASKRTYSNEYLFCPTQNLSPWSRYEVWLEVDYRAQFEWTFDTNGSFAGNPYECYYVENLSHGATIRAEGTDEVVIQGESDWAPFTLSKQQG